MIINSLDRDMNADMPTEFFFEGKHYRGEAVFINCYNGYTKSKGDAILCAVVNNSCFDKLSRPMPLTDAEGRAYHSENRRGSQYKIDSPGKPTYICTQ